MPRPMPDGPRILGRGARRGACLRAPLLATILATLLATLLAGCITGASVVDSQEVRVGGGDRVLLPFRVEEAGAVHFTAESRNGAPFTVCVLPMDHAASVPGQCVTNVRQASETVSLPAGEWALAIQCSPLVDSCAVAARAFEA